MSGFHWRLKLHKIISTFQLSHIDCSVISSKDLTSSTTMKKSNYINHINKESAQTSQGQLQQGRQET